MLLNMTSRGVTNRKLDSILKRSLVGLHAFEVPCVFGDRDLITYLH